MKRFIIFTIGLTLFCSMSFAHVSESRVRRHKNYDSYTYYYNDFNYYRYKQEKTVKNKNKKYYENSYSTVVNSIAILKPQGQNLNNSDDWLLFKIQSELMENFNLFSPIKISDRQSIETAIKEVGIPKDGIFTEYKQAALFGKTAGAEYILTGTLSDNDSIFVLSLKITSLTKNYTAASFSTECNADDIKNSLVICDATKELLNQLGIKLTQEGIKELYTVDGINLIQQQEQENNLKRRQELEIEQAETERKKEELKNSEATLNRNINYDAMSLLHRNVLFCTFDMPNFKSTVESDKIVLGGTLGYDSYIAGPLFWGISGGMFAKSYKVTSGDNSYINYEFEYNVLTELGVNYTSPYDNISTYIKTGCGFQSNYLTPSKSGVFVRLAAGIDISVFEFEYSFDIVPSSYNTIHRLAIGFCIPFYY